MKVVEVTLVLGPAKCGVLVQLNASARNCRRNRSLIGKSRVISRSLLITPGTVKMLRPLLPKVRGVVTGAKLAGLYQKLPGPMPPRNCTLGVSRFAVWVLSG